MTIKFDDGVEFDIEGEYRIERRRDGFYVVGRGMLCPVSTREEGTQLIKSLPDRHAETEQALCAEYDAWLKQKGYPALSADELSLEIQGDLPRAEMPADKLADVQWLDRFIERWDARAEA